MGMITKCDAECVSVETWHIMSPTGEREGAVCVSVLAVWAARWAARQWWLVFAAAAVQGETKMTPLSLLSPSLLSSSQPWDSAN